MSFYDRLLYPWTSLRRGKVLILRPAVQLYKSSCNINQNTQCVKRHLANFELLDFPSNAEMF